MTRKQALQQAIEIVNESTVDEETRKSIVEKLELCISELPFAKWSEEAVFDACDQYILEHKRPLTLKDFASKELPSHPTVRNRFGISLREFRDTYYPLPPVPDRTADRIQKDIQEVIREFAEEFKRIEAKTREDYDRRRDRRHPCSASLIRVSKASSWAELMYMAGVEYPPKTGAGRGSCYGTFRMRYRGNPDGDSK